MLGVNQSDFMSYMSALKTNYRKGIHRMEAILANPTHASEFAANLGGVSVVLGVPVGLPDRNSDKLLELLLGSDVADDAVETWLHQFYEFTGWDDLLSDSARCKEMANNPLIWRAAGGSKLAVGKSIATLAGLSCSAYKDIDAVAASSTAMAAIVASVLYRYGGGGSVLYRYGGGGSIFYRYGGCGSVLYRYGGDRRYRDGVCTLWRHVAAILYRYGGVWQRSSTAMAAMHRRCDSAAMRQ